MKLTDIFHRPQLTSLLHESDTSLTFGLLDPETGEVRQVVISADMAVLPDEALLSLTIHDEYELPCWSIESTTGLEFAIR